MNKLQKLNSLISGVFLIIIGVTLQYIGAEAAPYIMGIYALLMIINGVRLIIYYFTMARHMVGGQRILGKAVALIDLGLFAAYIINVPRGFVILYLLGIHLFEGVVDIFGALDAKKLGASSWRRRLLSGIYNASLFIYGLAAFSKPKILVTIYVIGVITSGFIRIANAFRKTASVYIA